MAEAIGLEAKYKITKADVNQTGTLTKGKKITEIEGTGTLKLNKVSSYMLKLLLEDVKQGKMPDITIADWEAGKLGEESYAFTFENAELIDAV